MGDDSEDPWRLAEALAGGVDAWKVIVDEFSTTIWHWARRQGLSKEEAEDVSQNVWYQLQDKGHTIKDSRALPGWLATTTRREAHRAKQRRERAGVLTVDADAYDLTLADLGPGPDESAIADDLQHRLASAFGELNENCRLLLSLCWEDRWSYAELAEILERPVGTIGPTRQRCLETLRKKAGLE